MKITIQQNAEDAIQFAYEIVKMQLNEVRINTIALSDGEASRRLYAKFAHGMTCGELDFSSQHIFALSEFLGISDTHPMSLFKRLDDHLFQNINVNPDNIHVPFSLPENVEDECLFFEDDIEYLGGLKLAILELGPNGQIGFNEPGTCLNGHTSITKLTSETQLNQSALSGYAATPPQYAITMGMGTIMSSQQIVVLATGADKAEAVASFLEGPVSAVFPASVLQNHENCCLILDRESATKLRFREYYQSSGIDLAKLDKMLRNARLKAGIC